VDAVDPPGQDPRQIGLRSVSGSLRRSALSHTRQSKA
jgi:hypothetical protein